MTTALQPSEAALVERAQAAPSLVRVREWAAINSGTANLEGIAAVRGRLADAFAVLPGTVREVAAEPVPGVDAHGAATLTERGAHLLVEVRPDAPRRLLLTGHIDTVFAADHPFQAVSDLGDGRLGGPGTADMKGGIAVMLAALEAIEAAGAGAAIGYDIVLNSDEETGSHASAGLIADRARGKLAAFTYEPAMPDGALAGARPGSGNFSLIVRGRAAHAGRNPADGRNAIVAAAAIVTALDGLRRAGLSVNPARIDGGGPNNVVPDLAIVRVNLRPADPALQAFADEAVKAIARDVAAAHHVAVTVEGGFNRPPKPATPQAERLQAHVRACGAALGIDVRFRATGGVCDGNNIAATGVPVIDTMGPVGGAIHSDGEYLEIATLGERAALSALAIARLAGGTA